MKNNYLKRSLVLSLISVSTLITTGCELGGSSGTTEPPIVEPTTINEDIGTVTLPDPNPTPDAIPTPDVIPVEHLSIIPTDEVRPYITDGPYSDVLKECALADFDNACQLSTLPYIGQDTNAPTIDDILNRTLVTHDWMGLRLNELLQTLPADMLYLFQPVTTVIIGSDIRPSSFQPANGVMKIDASHLWLTVEEKKNISRDEDFRTNFGRDLQFVSYWRLMSGDEHAIPFSSLLDYNERELDDILIRSAAPLYHELAHANDFMQPSNLGTLSFDLTPWEAVSLHWDDRIAARMYSDASMTSQASELYGLARIRYADEAPEEYQKTLQADFVGSVMSNEGKSRFYSYYTQEEDVATLFEQAMLKMHFDVDTHVGFMNKPMEHPDAFCEEYIVAWGTRNRIAAPLVLSRARWVTEQMLEPSFELDDFFSNNAGEETPLRMGDDWCNSRFSTPALVERSRSNTGTVSVDDMFRLEQRIYRNH